MPTNRFGQITKKRSVSIGLPGPTMMSHQPGKPIDTDRFFVICPNLLGGCRGTTGPCSTNPATGKPYGRDFPPITVGDMVEVQRRLLDQLGVGQLLAVVGGSLGGHQAMVWAARHAQRIRGVVTLASSPRLTSQALAFDVVGRNAILRDPHFHGGQYYDKPQGPDVGLALARMIGHITYLSPEAMNEKFEADRLRPRDVAIEFEKTFSVGSYLGYQGTKFVERFDANSYVAISLAMDLFNLGGTPAELAAAFAKARCRWLVLSSRATGSSPPPNPATSSTPSSPTARPPAIAMCAATAATTPSCCRTTSPVTAKCSAPS